MLVGGGIATFMAARQKERATLELPQNTNTAKASEVESPKKIYARESVQIFDFQSKYYSGFDGRVPGVEFKLRNAGARALKKVEVTVFFKDFGGQTIAEEKYYPVLVTRFDSSTPLKPGYIWQIERGQFYAAKSVPTEWSEGKAEARVTDIEFLEEDAQ